MEKDIRLEIVDEDEEGETLTAFNENDEIVMNKKFKLKIT